MVSVYNFWLSVVSILLPLWSKLDKMPDLGHYLYMDECKSIRETADSQVVSYLRWQLLGGADWPDALMGAIALWTTPEEVFEGTRLVYLIASEAFDWLTLAHRLSSEARDLIPEDELEDLLFTGRFPSRVAEGEFKDILGVDKNSAYLNYFYGVEVETALQQVVEAEIEKRFYASGRQYTADHTNEAFQRIYNSTRDDLLVAYWEQSHRPYRNITTLTELKEFTYWLFKRRLNVSDKAKIASDTKKGIAALDPAMRIPGEIGG